MCIERGRAVLDLRLFPLGKANPLRGIPTPMQDGVIQYEIEHTRRKLRTAERDAALSLIGWRSVLQDCGLLGQSATRYDGVGFGNLSTRVGPRSATRGRRAFVVSATQSSGRRAVCDDDFAVVLSWSVRSNELCSAGANLPSSESLTHASIYDEAVNVQAVLHGHSPEIWAAHDRLRLPFTPAGVDYGTVAMAEATRALFRAGRVHETSAFVMRGHEDGVVAFGRTVDDAGATLLTLLARARALR